MKIKIIDLLNKIANGEEVPKRIKYKDEIRNYADDDKDYRCSGSENYYLFFDVLHKGTGAEFKKALNDEVEILEEEKKIPEKIQTIGSKWYSDYIESYIVEEDKYSCYDELLMNKINEILDYLESKEKGE